MEYVSLDSMKTTQNIFGNILVNKTRKQRTIVDWLPAANSGQPLKSEHMQRMIALIQIVCFLPNNALLCLVT